MLRRMAKEKGSRVRSVTAFSAMEGEGQPGAGPPPGLDKMVYPWQEIDKVIAQFHPKAK